MRTIAIGLFVSRAEDRRKQLPVTKFCNLVLRMNLHSAHKFLLRTDIELQSSWLKTSVLIWGFLHSSFTPTFFISSWLTVLDSLKACISLMLFWLSLIKISLNYVFWYMLFIMINDLPFQTEYQGKIYFSNLNIQRVAILLLSFGEVFDIRDKVFAIWNRIIFKSS